MGISLGIIGESLESGLTVLPTRSVTLKSKVHELPDEKIMVSAFGRAKAHYD